MPNRPWPRFVAIACGCILAVGSATPAVAASPPGWTLYRDTKNGFSVSIPPGWARVTADDHTYSSVDLLGLQTDPENADEPGELCPSNGFNAELGVGILINLVELAVSDSVVRDSGRPPFTDRSGYDATLSCNSGPPTNRIIDFSDMGRKFRLTLVFGDRAPANRRAEVYEILNSLHFARDEHLDRYPLKTTITSRPPPPEQGKTSVFVLDGSGVGQAAASMANDLAGGGYAIAGLGDAPTRENDTAACRRKASALQLARNVGPGTNATAPPDHPTLGSVHADCIVVLGTAGNAVSQPRGGETYHDGKNGMTVSIPLGWEPLDFPTGAWPLSLLFVASKGASVFGCGVSGVSYYPGTEVSVSVDESVGTYEPPPRPIFGPFTGELGGHVETSPTCPGTEPTRQFVQFRDHGRLINVLVVIGAHAPEQLRTEAYGILNSLQFEPESALDRPPITLRLPKAQPTPPLRRPKHHPYPPSAVAVAVLNGSGISSDASVHANQLRGLGYVIAAVGNAVPRTGTTVACREHFDAEARQIARVIRGSKKNAKVASFPATPPPETELADCIVVVGS